MTRKIVFLTGTRADFGKLSSLMDSIESDDAFGCHIFVTVETYVRIGLA